MEDLISKKGRQYTITVLSYSDSVILINQRKGRYLRLASGGARAKSAVPMPRDTRRGAYLPSLFSR